MGKRGGQKRWVLYGPVGNLLVAVFGTACASVTAPPPQAQAACVPAVPAATSTSVNESKSPELVAAPTAVTAPPPVGAAQSSSELPVSLAAEHIVPVIAAAAPSVKAQCWQPGLDAGAPGVPASARVLVHAQIGPSGSVTAASTEDSPPGYPQLADCVVKLVRSLTFHRAVTTTSVNIPFIFDAKPPSNAAAPANADAPAQ